MRRTRGTDFKQFKIAETVLREIFSRDGRRLMKRFIKISADNVGFDLIKSQCNKAGGGTETVRNLLQHSFQIGIQRFGVLILTQDILTVISQGPTTKN